RPENYLICLQRSVAVQSAIPRLPNFRCFLEMAKRVSVAGERPAGAVSQAVLGAVAHQVPYVRDDNSFWERTANVGAPSLGWTRPWRIEERPFQQDYLHFGNAVFQAPPVGLTEQ